MEDYNEDTVKMLDESLEDWVMYKVNNWRDYYETNYNAKFDEYYRMWRGIWSSDDKTRESERSKIVSPALLQAVENNVADIEEATFGRGKFFDIEDDARDTDRSDVRFLREALSKEFTKNKIRKAVGECLINAAVYGTGIGEIVLEKKKEMVPATEPVMEGAMTAVGVNVRDRTVVKLRPVQPQNFLIDPVATDIESAVGVAIDEFVSTHSVEQLQEEGVYKKGHIGRAASDLEIEPDVELWQQPEDKVRLTKYYGLVPRQLLENAFDDDDEEVVNFNSDDDDEGRDSYYVEAIIVIGNGGKLLKAEASPYMMEDRPVVAFPWDVVPNRFWGMGVCEKGFNSQKALDAELRARIDALALTVHPMMAMDATRMPRGSKPEVKAGKLLLTNGNPAEVLHPFNFGQVSQITFAQADSLQRMVQAATGSVDTAQQAMSGGGTTSAGSSMSLGGVIKRQKRTLVNFQESFLIPFTEKAAWRYMQFEPELFPVNDYKFIATSTLGIVAREYEVAQLVQLLQTMPQDSPVYPIILQSVIDNMNITNREDLIETMVQAQQPNPEQQQMQQALAEEDRAFKNSQTAALTAQANESNARAKKIELEGRGIPVELETDRIKAVASSVSATDDDKDFEKRMRLASLALDEKKLGLVAAKEINSGKQ
tara:strand:+ start:2016 stop:3977 length:1962 start_codon:yes stop_codon:yes gene_type:complete